MNFLKTEIEKFIQHTKKNNFYISKWSYSTIWGGSSLLEMHLKSLKEIISKKDKNEWNWDYVINLSETDFPIKSIQELTLFLSKQGEKNFLKFFKSSYEKFSQNQGFEVAFLECENRMWRLGNKKYPIGIQFSGGSDWFCLNSKFVNYLIKSKENYIEELKKFFSYSLLPSEAFFHTVLQNSPFCDESYKNTHLRFVNWKRSRGCNCQHKKIVDWCGCSPNYLTYKHDLEILKDFKDQPVFFSRKFDPLNNQLMINIMDQSIFGLYQTEFKSLNSYWENVYDQGDKFENEFVKLFMFFSKISEEKLKQRVYALGEEISLDQSLRKVNAFFEADTFKGYVLNLKTENTNFNIEYESYFTVKNLKSNIKIFELSEKQNQSLVLMRENFLQSLIIARVSSDFDQKERKFSNYANVMSVNSNPILQMEFDPISEPLEFIIAWFDPNDIELKQTKVKFNTSEKNQLMLHSLQKMDNFTQLNKSGIWKIEIYLQGMEKNLILSIRFLVVPKENFQDLDLRIWIPIIDNFWQFNSICFFKGENLKNKNSILFDNLFKSCKKESFWSSYYPDPKSDIYENLEIDLIHRIV
ncbi:unnamed protein product [Brachionus calyciflorus]|uniref:protein xylosyltransferase n=1 Tax=Brachionus calyciflorus TaxID=104777 RepID=A0A813TKY2_9BILA|nr:unnamed protein product [Brachionus calyciflorus]